jgi:hypothetical protein
VWIVRGLSRLTFRLNLGRSAFRWGVACMATLTAGRNMCCQRRTRLESGCRTTLTPAQVNLSSEVLFCCKCDWNLRRLENTERHTNRRICVIIIIAFFTLLFILFVIIFISCYSSIWRALLKCPVQIPATGFVLSWGCLGLQEATTASFLIPLITSFIYS